MRQRQGGADCNRHGASDRGIEALDPRMICALTVARFFFQSFSAPQLEGWTRALSGAEQMLGSKAGPEFACGVLRMVQAMRCSRKSVFHFSNPDCGHCASTLSGHERLLMHSLWACLKGRPEDAAGLAMLLCEGNDTSDLVAAMTDLAGIMRGLRGAPWVRA